MVRSVLGGIAVVLTSLATVACSTTNSGVVGQALWHGTASDGEPTAGTLAFSVTATSSDAPDFTVETAEMRGDGGGEMWVATASSAAVIAALAAGRDVSGLELNFTVDGAIDGPSAGGLMTAASYAAIIGQHVLPQVSMTGAVLPDGTLAPVGGVPQKIVAAAKEGITTVLIPASQSPYTNYSTGEVVDVVELGESAGVRVVPVASVWEGYEELTGQPVTPLGEATPPPIAPAVLDVYATATRNLLDSASSAEGTAIPGSVNEGDARSFLTQSRTDAEEALDRGDPIVAFTAASTLQLQQTNWSVAARSEELAGTDLVGFARTLAEQARSLTVNAQRVLTDVGGQPWNSVEAATGIPTALLWAVSAMHVGNLTQLDLKRAKPLTGEYLVQMAVTLSAAQQQLEIFTPVIADSIRVLPTTTPLSAAGVEDLDTLIRVVQQSAAANLAYLSTRADSALESNFNYRTLQQQPPFPVPATPEMTLSWVLHEWLTTVALVAELGAVEATPDPSDGQLNSITILDPRQFSTEIRGAAAALELQSRTLAARNVNSSALRAQAQWGEGFASSKATLVGDSRRRLGLAVQWGVLISGALARPLAPSP